MPGTATGGRHDGQAQVAMGAADPTLDAARKIADIVVPRAEQAK
jgi:hypothetical protein